MENIFELKSGTSFEILQDMFMHTSDLSRLHFGLTTYNVTVPVKNNLSIGVQCYKCNYSDYKYFHLNNLSTY